MPAFHPIGFFLPLSVAMLYMYRALPYWRSRNTVYMALLAVVTYLVPIAHPKGVVLVPLYVLVMAAAICPRDNPPRWWPDSTPLAVMLPYAFAAIAVPDFFLTWQMGGTHWTVGGAAWQDGLLRFWLYLIPVFAAFRLVFDFAVAHDSHRAFSLPGWLSEQLSPLPPRDPALPSC